MRTLTLPGVPSLAGSYARAVGSTMRAMVLRRPPGSDPPRVPDVAYAVQGVRADPDRLAAYQHLMGEAATDELPAGYVHVLAFPLAMAVLVRDDFPLPVLGLVHLANRVELFQPVFADEPFDARAYARGLAPHRRGTQVEVVTEVAVAGRRRTAGRAVPRALLWREVATYLARGVHLPGQGEPPDVAPPPPPFRPPEATCRWDLASDVGRRYAGVSGDSNPIHLTALTARPLGFRRAIAHGMYTAARALAVVGPARGDAYDWDVTFDAPVLLPGRVDVRIAREDGTYTFVGWEPTAGRRHFAGTVTPR